RLLLRSAMRPWSARGGPSRRDGPGRSLAGGSPVVSGGAGGDRRDRPQARFGSEDGSSLPEAGTLAVVFGPVRTDTLLAEHAGRAPQVCYSAQVLFQELRRHGYRGGYDTVRRFVQPLRAAAREMRLRGAVLFRRFAPL